MPAFGLERLNCVQGHRLPVRLVRHGHLMFPFDRMGIQHQFVFFVQIIEDRYLAVSHNDQFLFLEGMQPRTKTWAFTPLENESRLTVTSAIR